MIAIPGIAFMIFVSICAITGFAREADDKEQERKYLENSRNCWTWFWEIEHKKALDYADILRKVAPWTLQKRSKGRFTKGAGQ